MKKIQTTYKQLHELLGKDPSIEYFVKSPTGNYTKILATCQKRSDTYSVDFDNGVSFIAGDKHAFMNMINQAVCTDKLIPGESIKTLTGSTKVVARYDFKENQDVYDIMVGDPHWYTNDEQHGIIHHNTTYALMIAAAYLEKHKDAILMFYDTEFGAPQAYFTSCGVDLNRVLHIPIKNIEELKFDLINQLEQITRKDKVIIIIDSVGNIASRKEVDDALKENSAADMTRAKALKGLFRMVTPYLSLNDIPMIVINHVYECGTKEMTVQTPDGNISLSSIKIGDTVMTETGWEKVSFVTSHENASITDVTMEDGTILSFTEGHRFKVNGKWKFLSELMPGDILDIKE